VYRRKRRSPSQGENTTQKQTQQPTSPVLPVYDEIPDNNYDELIELDNRDRPRSGPYDHPNIIPGPVTPNSYQPLGTAAENPISSTARPDYPETTVGPEYQQPTVDPDYRESTARADYLHTTVNPDYQEPTVSFDYPEPTVNPDYQQPTVSSDYLEPTASRDLQPSVNPAYLEVIDDKTTETSM